MDPPEQGLADLPELDLEGLAEVPADLLEADLAVRAERLVAPADPVEVVDAVPLRTRSLIPRMAKFLTPRLLARNPTI